MIERLIYLFVMCAIMRSVKTVQNITQIAGQKFATSVMIALDTVLFLLVFRDVLIGEITMPVVLAVSAGYIVGYYAGAYIEERMALGKVIVTIKIAKSRSLELSKILRKNGFVFIQSKRYYSHKGKLRKIHQGIVYRKELPKLKRITREFNIVATVEDVKSTFGKRLLSSEEYLEVESKKNNMLPPAT